MGPALQSLTIVPEGGLPLQLRLLLPPNLVAAAGRGQIAVRLELLVDGKACVAEKVDAKQALTPDAPTFLALALLESWSGGSITSLWQLSTDQLSQLLQPLSGQPVIYWVNRALEALVWEGDRLPGVHEHLLAKAVAKEVAKPQKTVAKKATKRVAAQDLMPMRVDGSSNFLAISLPSRESLLYEEARALLTEWKFRLEPSNGKWWIRDRDRTLAFLAEHWDPLREHFQAEFSESFTQRTGKLRFATLQADFGPEGGGLHYGHKGLDERVLSRALARGSRYVEEGEQVVLLRGQDRRRLSEIQQRLSGDPTRHTSPTYRLRAGAEAAATLEMLEEAGVPTRMPEDWRRALAGLSDPSSLPPAPVGELLRERLRAYQLEGVAWLWRLCCGKLGGILADEMGLGKTVQAIAAMRALASEQTGGMLVACPASLVENWLRELGRWWPEARAIRHHGASRSREAGSLLGAQVVVTSYGTLTRDRELLADVDWSLLIADEAQQARNRRSQLAKALRSLRVRTRIALTGTPVENSLSDLQSLFAFLLPGYLPDLKVAAKDREWEQSRVLRLCAPYILRRQKSDVAKELPARIDQPLYCAMGERQLARYQELSRRGLNELEKLASDQAGEGRLRLAVFNQLLRLRQWASEPRVLEEDFPREESTKNQLFFDCLGEAVEGGHRLLVFSSFVSVLKVLATDLEEDGYSFRYLDGATRNRQALVDEFNEDDSISVFLISLKAGGVGLNLTGADTVVLYDPWWNPAAEAQAIDRAHRIGQERQVTALRLLAAESVEEKVESIKREKSALLEAVFEESAGNSSSLDWKGWRELIS